MLPAGGIRCASRKVTLAATSLDAAGRGPVKPHAHTLVSNAPMLKPRPRPDTSSRARITRMASSYDIPPFPSLSGILQQLVMQRAGLHVPAKCKVQTANPNVHGEPQVSPLLPAACAPARLCNRQGASPAAGCTCQGAWRYSRTHLHCGWRGPRLWGRTAFVAPCLGPGPCRSSRRWPLTTKACMIRALTVRQGSPGAVDVLTPASGATLLCMSWLSAVLSYTCQSAKACATRLHPDGDVRAGTNSA